MYKIRPTARFQHDLKRVRKRGYDISMLTDVIKKLAEGVPLPAKNKDHRLIGDCAGLPRMPHNTGLALDLRNMRRRADSVSHANRDA